MDYGLHRSVLLHETIALLAPQSGETYLDATIGSGGHASEICRASGGDVRIVGIDADNDALTRSRAVLAAAGCKTSLLVKANFRELSRVLDEANINSVDMALFDLGVSSNQLAGKEEGGAGRGFSFRHDEPLLMTLDDAPEGATLTAATVVNDWPEAELAAIIRHYGDERYARRIAAAIVAAREDERIETSSQLASIIEATLPKGYERGRIHPATRTFQAIRMVVNDEWEALQEGLEAAFSRLSHGGRLVVISFHSIEDRAVKRFMQGLAKADQGVLLTKKPIVAGAEELAENPRARSAKLRGIRKE